MRIVYIIVGLPGSGKSTRARQMVADAPLGTLVRLNRDAIRDMFYRPAPHGDSKFEAMVTEHQLAAMRAHLAAGRSVIIDDTNLKRAYRQPLIDLAEEFGAVVEIIDMTDVDVELCIWRDSQRATPAPDHARFEHVGEANIRRMAKEIEL